MVRPDGLSLEDWAATLQIDFPASSVPEYYAGSDWVEWAQSVLEFGGFNGPSVPLPRTYANWLDWANAFYALMQNEET